MKYCEDTGWDVSELGDVIKYHIGFMKILEAETRAAKVYRHMPVISILQPRKSAPRKAKSAVQVDRQVDPQINSSISSKST